MNIKFLGQEIKGTFVNGMFCEDSTHKVFCPVSLLLQMRKLSITETSTLQSCGIVYIPVRCTAEEVVLMKDNLPDDSKKTAQKAVEIIQELMTK